MLRTLRGQYLLGSVVVFAAMLGLLLWNALHLTRQAFEERFESEHRAYGPLMVAAIGPLMAVRDHASVADVVAQNVGTGHLSFVEVVDARGVEITAAGRRDGPMRLGRLPILVAGQAFGEVRFGIPTDWLTQMQARLARSGLLIGLAVLLAGTLALAVATTWLSRGFRRLSLASRRVADGDYATRLPPSRIHELEDVSQAFNRMAEAVQAQLAAVRDSEQFLRRVIDTASEGMIIIDRERRVLDCNEALLQLWGTTREAVTHADAAQHGARLHWPDGQRMQPDELPSVRAFATGQPQRDIFCQVLRAGGDRRWLSINATPLVREGASEPHAVLATLTDITRHVEAERLLRESNEALEARVRDRTAELRCALAEAQRASQAKTEFLSRMSHELRTPLNAILGFAQLLLIARAKLGEAEVQKVGQIESAGWHLLGLIDDVLDLARIEAGAMSTSAEPVELGTLVGDVVPLVQTLAETHQVTIAAPPAAPGGAWVLADRKRLRQVLLNLLSNAVKYNRRGGRVEITIAAAADASRVLAVRDTGRGFRPDELTHLYEPFTRFKRDGETVEGTGIGLVITKRLVELMRGRIEVESVAGEGSVFRVVLPGAPAPAVPAIAHADPAGTATPPTGARRRVLYVEDNPSNVDLLRQVLAMRSDIALEVAGDGLVGLAMLRSRPFELAIVDIDLPGIDGIELCRRLKADPATRAIPLIALSANAMEPDIRRAREAGFALYLTKPIDVPRLLADVAGVLDATPAVH